MLNFSDRTVIFANGEVPRHAVPLLALKRARRIICCDGAADKLLRMGRDPEWVVGDMDSISGAARECFRDRTVADADQSRNDLTKAFKLCLKHGWREIAVVGAAGGREDHTLGNLSLLVDFARQLDIVMLTDSGIFLPLTDRGVIECEPGQQVSVFSFDPATSIQSCGLKYPLNGVRLSRWWQAALNEAVAEQVSLDFDGGPLLVFLAYKN